MNYGNFKKNKWLFIFSGKKPTIYINLIKHLFKKKWIKILKIYCFLKLSFRIHVLQYKLLTKDLYFFLQKGMTVGLGYLGKLLTETVLYWYTVYTWFLMIIRLIRSGTKPLLLNFQNTDIVISKSSKTLFHQKSTVYPPAVIKLFFKIEPIIAVLERGGFKTI